MDKELFEIMIPYEEDKVLKVMDFMFPNGYKFYRVMKALCMPTIERQYFKYPKMITKNPLCLIRENGEREWREIKLNDVMQKYENE